MKKMKKFIYCALMALIAISCEKIEESWENPEEDSWIDIPVVIPRTLSAYSPEFGSQGSDSKTRALSEDLPESWDESEMSHTRTYAVINPDEANEYIQYWSEGDAISLFLTTKNLQYQMSSYMDGTLDVGKFDLVGNEAVGNTLNTNYYYSVYPYKEDTEISKKGKVTYTFPATQHYSGDSYANGENGMIAIKPKEEWKEDEDNILYFKNFCSYLQLRLATDEGSKKVRKITLVANSNTDKIAGPGTIEIKDVNSAPVVEMKRSGSVNQITLDCGGVELSQDENNPTKFWFVVPGGFTFTEGFSISIIFDDNSYYKKSTSKEIGIERSHIKPMATFKTISKTATGPIRYKYNDTSIKEPYSLSNTFYGEDGLPLDIIDQVYNEDTNEWTVLLSGTLKTIGGNSFQELSPDIEYIKIDNGDKPIAVSEFAFYNCTADKIEINNKVDEIKESAFTGSTIKDLVINGDVTNLRNSVGTGSKIESINITGSVELIDEQAFSGCTALQTVNVGSVGTIGYRAFYMCSALKNVNIPGVKYVDMGAFRNCTSLETIRLESVEVIDDNAFMDCSSLTEAIISEHCTMIGEGAFCNAVNLQTVYCYAIYPPFIKTDNYDCSYVFDNVHEDIVIYIPSGSEDYYIDDEYFEDHTYEDPNIEAEVNWWYEEYEDFLCEMENLQ